MSALLHLGVSIQVLKRRAKFPGKCKLQKEKSFAWKAGHFQLCILNFAL
jgi:hypothetical protein